jgi:hypothetical protein
VGQAWKRIPSRGGSRALRLRSLGRSVRRSRDAGAGERAVVAHRCWPPVPACPPAGDAVGFGPRDGSCRPCVFAGTGRAWSPTCAHARRHGGAAGNRGFAPQLRRQLELQQSRGCHPVVDGQWPRTAPVGRLRCCSIGPDRTRQGGARPARREEETYLQSVGDEQRRRPKRICRRATKGPVEQSLSHWVLVAIVAATSSRSVPEPTRVNTRALLLAELRASQIRPADRLGLCLGRIPVLHGRPRPGSPPGPWRLSPHTAAKAPTSPMLAWKSSLAATTS